MIVGRYKGDLCIRSKVDQIETIIIFREDGIKVLKGITHEIREGDIIELSMDTISLIPSKTYSKDKDFVIKESNYIFFHERYSDMVYYIIGNGDINELRYDPFIGHIRNYTIDVDNSINIKNESDMDRISDNTIRSIVKFEKLDLNINMK